MNVWLLLLTLLTGMLLSAPMTLQADALHSGSTLVRIRLACAGFTRTWHLQLRRTGQGLQLTVAAPGKAEKTVQPESYRGTPGERLGQLLLRSAGIRRFLLRHVHLDNLLLSLRMHADNAAHTALLTSLGQTAAALLPPRWHDRITVRVSPQFAGVRSRLQGRCILHLRLGTILMTSAMLLAALAAQHGSKAREAA